MIFINDASMQFMIHFYTLFLHTYPSLQASSGAGAAQPPQGRPPGTPKGRAAVNQTDALPWELAASCRAAPQSSEHSTEAKVRFSKESEHVVHPSGIPRLALPKFPAQVLRPSHPEAVTRRCRRPRTYKPRQTRRSELPCNSCDSCLVGYFTFHIGSG